MRGEHRIRSGTDIHSGVVGVGVPRERTIADLAARQRGVVTRTQLLDAGLTPHAVDHRLRSGRLHALHRGVYLLGHSVPPEGARELAAVLACGLAPSSATGAPPGYGDCSGIPEMSSTSQWGAAIPATSGESASTASRRSTRTTFAGSGGFRLPHQSARSSTWAAVVEPRALERAVAEAETRRLTRRNELLSVLARAGRRPGVAALRSLIESDVTPALTRSEAEERFLALVRMAELPPPEANVRIGRHEVDFLWRGQGVVVEIDGFRFHSSRAAFERDRLRDAALAAKGLRVIRVTWRQIVYRPEALIARLAAALTS